MSTVMVNDPVMRLTAEHAAAIGMAVTAMRAESDYPFTVETLAEISNFSLFHFARLFRSLIGIPPGEFLTALRYDRAKELLLTTDLSVTDICFEVGYDSLGTFSSRFKQLVGVGPAGFRALPEVLDTLTIDASAAASSIPPEQGNRATIRGHIVNPPTGAHAYVGIFPASIARGYPVAGARVAANTPFILPNLPRGKFRLLCAAVSASTSTRSHLLPGADLRVASHPEIISIETGKEVFDLPLLMRPLHAHEPPVLIALPALDLRCLQGRSDRLPRSQQSVLKMLATGD